MVLAHFKCSEEDELAVLCLYLAQAFRALSPHGRAAVLDIVQEINDTERFDRLLED